MSEGIDMPTQNTLSIWSMILGSGPIVLAVLLLLVAFSLAAWTIIFAKIKRFKKASDADDDFEETFWENDNLAQVQTKAIKSPNSPMAGVFLSGYEELKRLQETVRQVDTPVDMKVWVQALERSLQKSIKEELKSLEFSIPFLATIGNAGPFIGLFGTVWGIMKSFHDIGQQGSANLATVAPGISEALVATAVGLLAAIPAVIAFNSFTSHLSTIEARLEGFSGDFINAVERRLVKSRTASRSKDTE